MTNQELFIKKMRLCGYKVESLARAIGLSRAGLYKKINNSNEFKASEIVKISKLFGLSPEEQDNIFFVD